jgi:CRISPR-associated endonuclease Csn1
MSEKNGKNEKFFIGLDIGTSSVGFAATDENYNVLRHAGKPLMGVRIFDEAETAKKRRVLRANSVRMRRVKFRITLLQELFASEIEKIDPLFYLRLEASSYWLDDKEKAVKEGVDGKLSTADSLFADGSYTDKEFHRGFIDRGGKNKKAVLSGGGFPSAYHLRKYLTDGTEKPDIRLVYLACHHILKARGNFLYEAKEFKAGDAGAESFGKLNKYLERLAESSDDGDAFQFSIEKFSEIEAVAKDEKLVMSNKKEK